MEFQNKQLIVILNDLDIQPHKKLDVKRRFSNFNDWIDNIFEHVSNTKI